LIVAAGVTLFESLKAADRLKEQGISVAVMDAYCVKPLAVELICEVARKANDLVLTVEDHFSEGGLGDAVAGALSQYNICVHKMAVTELPHSGEPAELIVKYGIDAAAIVVQVKRMIAVSRTVDEELLTQ